MRYFIFIVLLILPAAVLSLEAEANPAEEKHAQPQAAANNARELSLLEKAEDYLKKRYFYEARSGYKVFIKNFPNSQHIHEAYLGLAKSFSETGSLKDALRYYEMAGKSAEALFGKADTLQKSGMLKEASDAYALALQEDNGYPQKFDESAYYLGENLRLTGKEADAKKYLSAIKEPLFKVKADLSLGLIAMQEAKAEEAAKYFRSVLSSTQIHEKRQALLSLSEMQEKAGKTEDAKKNLEEIRTNYPYGKKYDTAILKLSRIYGKEGKFKEAESLLKELIFRQVPVKEALDGFQEIILDVKDKDKSQFLSLWSSVGHWLMDNSREEFLIEILDSLKGTGKPYLELSKWLAKYGSKAARINALTVNADFYAETGDMVRAEESLKELKALGVSSSDGIYRIKASISYANKDMKGAAEELMQIKEMNKKDLELFGRTLDYAKNTEKAISVYEKALNEAGGSVNDYRRIADILYEKGKRAEAAYYYKLILTIDAENQWALYRVASLSEPEKAEEAYQKLNGKSSLFGSLARARLKELTLNKKIMEIF
ncbi:MAG: tetratricopeptide repeat protein [Nitrospirae bacterium]|nr:tetratricopeptide repeat protein [Nitrospirota bacterium]